MKSCKYVEAQLSRKYSGAGKSELIHAFAAHAEHENKVVGGVYWVAVDVELTDVLDSSARLVEKFREGKYAKKSEEMLGLERSC